MDQLLATLREEVHRYGKHGLNVRFFPLLDDLHQNYAITALPLPDREQGPEIVMMARLEGEYIIIEADNTDRPLYEALMARGIPRERIILAYVGESLPEAQGV
jgi:hypothetical protein